MPGPGDYKPRVPNKPMSTCKFAKTALKPAPALGTSPAPGNYDPRPIDRKLPMTNSFISKSKRSIDRQRDTPSPVAYQQMYASSPPKGPSAAFVGSVNARKRSVDPYHPFAKEPVETSPGPGQYSYELPKRHRALVFSKHRLDRFGHRASVLVTPGPGEYFPQADTTSEPKPGAVFRSASERGWLAAPTGQPGPAFYSPALLPKRQSYHSNSPSQWL